MCRLFCGIFLRFSQTQRNWFGIMMFSKKKKSEPNFDCCYTFPIWCRHQTTVFRLVPNQTEKCNYNPNTKIHIADISVRRMELHYYYINNNIYKLKELYIYIHHISCENDFIKIDFIRFYFIHVTCTMPVSNFPVISPVISRNFFHQIWKKTYVIKIDAPFLYQSFRFFVSIFLSV